MGLKAQGCYLERGDGAASETFTSVGEVVDWTGPDGQSSQIDLTHLESTSRQRVSGLDDPGNFGFTILFDPSTSAHQNLESDKNNSSESNWRFQWVDADGASIGYHSFAGTVDQLSTRGRVNERVEANCNIVMNGGWTFTAA